MNEPYRDATLGDILRERRLTIQMTMREVAGSTLSPTAVNNIEKGKIKPTIETVLYLCQVLQILPEHLLLFYHDLSKSIPELLKIVDSFLQEDRIDDSITLLYDMYWVATEDAAHEELIAEIQFKLSSVFGQIGRYESAQNVMLEAYKHFVVHKNILKQIEAFNKMGEYSIAERKYDLAISFCSQALDLVQRYQVQEAIVAQSYLNLITASFRNGEFRDALSVCRQAKTFLQKIDDLHGLACNALQEASILAAFGEIDEAHVIASHTYRYFASADKPSATVHAALVLGDILVQKQQFSEAKEYYLHALKLSQNHKLVDCSTVHMALAKLELAQQNTAKAREQAGQGLQCAYTAMQQAQVHKLLAMCDLQAGDREGYTLQMQSAAEALHSGGETIASALIQCELADETDDMELMRQATRKLRELCDIRHIV